MNKSKINKFSLAYFIGLIKWLVSVMGVKAHKQLLSILIPYVEKIFRVIQTRGVKEAISYNKEMRLKFLKLVFNNFDVKTLEFKVPKLMKPFIKSKELQEKNALRAFLSVLFMTRFLRLKPVASYETISKAPSYTGNPTDLRPMIFEFLKDIGFNPKHLGRKPSSLNFKKYHMSIKSGPNGPALWTSLQDYLSLPEDLKKHLQVLGGPKFSGHFKELDMLSQDPVLQDSFGFTEKRDIRKIALLSDKEGKTREVAIGDYWTQCALRPLHIYQSKILKRIKGDCMFDQTKHFKSLVKSTNEDSYHSIDLSSATDRFPIKIQKEMILLIAGSEYAESWEKVMVGYPFKTTSGPLLYGTGNPMGFYSSFSSFSLAHHFFVWLACKRAQVSFNKLPYMLLGDDIVIGNDKVAETYKALLVEWDIPFNKAKTHVSKYGFEFAKQIRFHKDNISPLSLSSIYNNRNDYKTSILFLVEELKNKEWNIDSGVFIESFLRTVHRFSAKRFRKTYPKIRLSLAILDYLQGNLTSLGDELIHYVRRSFKYSPAFENPAIQQVFSNEILRAVLIQEQKSNQNTGVHMFRNQKNTKILRIMNYIGRSKDYNRNDSVEALPFTSYYKHDVINDIIRTLYESKQITLTDKYSPERLRKIYSVDVRPLNVSDLYARHREVTYKTSWNIATEFANTATSVKEIKVFNKKYPLNLVPV